MDSIATLAYNSAEIVLRIMILFFRCVNVTVLHLRQLSKIRGTLYVQDVIELSRIVLLCVNISVIYLRFSHIKIISLFYETKVYKKHR